VTSKQNWTEMKETRKRYMVKSVKWKKRRGPNCRDQLLYYYNIGTGLKCALQHPGEAFETVFGNFIITAGTIKTRSIALESLDRNTYDCQNKK